MHHHVVQARQGCVKRQIPRAPLQIIVILMFISLLLGTNSYSFVGVLLGVADNKNPIHAARETLLQRYPPPRPGRVLNESIAYPSATVPSKPERVSTLAYGDSTTTSTSTAALAPYKLRASRCRVSSTSTGSAAQGTGAWAGLAYEVRASVERCGTHAMRLVVSVRGETQSAALAVGTAGEMTWRDGPAEGASGTPTGSRRPPIAVVRYRLDVDATSAHLLFSTHMCVAEGICVPICTAADLETLKGASCLLDTKPFVAISIAWAAVALLCGAALGGAYWRKQQLLQAHEAALQQERKALQRQGPLSPPGSKANRPREPLTPLSSERILLPTSRPSHPTGDTTINSPDATNGSSSWRYAAASTAAGTTGSERGLASPEKTASPPAALPHVPSEPLVQERPLPSWLQYHSDSNTAVDANGESPSDACPLALSLSGVYDTGNAASSSWDTHPLPLQHTRSHHASASGLGFLKVEAMLQALQDDEERSRATLYTSFMESPQWVFFAIQARELEQRCAMELAEEERWDHLVLLVQLQLAQRLSRRIAQKKRLEDQERHTRSALQNQEQDSWSLAVLQPSWTSQQSSMAEEEQRHRQDIDSEHEISLACLLSSFITGHSSPEPRHDTTATSTPQDQHDAFPSHHKQLHSPLPSSPLITTEQKHPPPSSNEIKKNAASLTAEHPDPSDNVQPAVLSSIDALATNTNAPNPTAATIIAAQQDPHPPQRETQRTTLRSLQELQRKAAAAAAAVQKLTEEAAERDALHQQQEADEAGARETTRQREEAEEAQRQLAAAMESTAEEESAARDAVHAEEAAERDALHQQQEADEAGARETTRQREEAEEAQRQLAAALESTAEEESAARDAVHAEEAAERDALHQQQEADEAGARETTRQREEAEEAQRQLAAAIEEESIVRKTLEVEEWKARRSLVQREVDLREVVRRCVLAKTPLNSRSKDAAVPPLSKAPPFIGFSLGEYVRGRKLVVDGFYEGGPAHTAGICLGDVLLMINGHSVSSIEDVRDVLRRTSKVGELSFFELQKDNAFQERYRVGIRVLTADPRYKGGVTPFYFDVKEHKQLTQQ